MKRDELKKELELELEVEELEDKIAPSGPPIFSRSHPWGDCL
jgi:hypothetical protein